MNKNILVIDDDISVLKGFEKILKEDGYDVDTAEDTKKAIEHFSRRNYFVIIIDLVLKDENGLDFVKMIKRMATDTIIIIITGYPSSEYAAKSFRYGAFEYLEKPLTRDVLLGAIQRGLKNRELNQANKALAHLSRENPNPILLVEKDGRILYSNQAASSLVECLVNPGEDFLSVHWQQFVQKAYDGGESMHTQPECNGRIYSLTFVPVENVGCVNIYGVDLTDSILSSNKGKKTSEIIELLTKTTELGGEKINSEGAMRKMLKLVCRFMGWPVGHVYFRKQDKMVPSDIWHIEGLKGYSKFQRVTEQTSFSSGEGMIGRVMAVGRSIWIRDVTKDSSYVRSKLAQDIEVKAALAFPVFIGEEVSAILEFHAEEPVDLDESTINIITTVGAQLGRILERKYAYEKLRETNDMFQNICNFSYDAIVMCDDEGNVTYWSEASERIFGYKANEVIGKDLHGLITPERYRENAKRGLLKFKETGRGAIIGQAQDLTALKKDGTEFPIELSVSAINMRGKWCALGTIRDVFERKKTEEELKNQMLELRAFNEMAVGRELRMIEIKKEINQLCQELGKPERYKKIA